MFKYCFYQSGIHYANIIFEENYVKETKEDVFTDSWTDERVLKDEDILKYEQICAINFKSLHERLDEIINIFPSEKKDYIRTSWGAEYQKFESNPSYNVWSERNKKFPLDIIVAQNKVVGFICTQRESCNILVEQGCEDYSPLKLWREKVVSKDCYAVEFKGTYMVPMRDGVRLATDLWMPKNVDKEIPAIFVRTPYGRELYAQLHFKYVQRGYAVVIQDVRGRQSSEGEWIPMHYEIEDGDDSINWIANNEWSDKNVGMIGASYGGYVQWAAAASGNKYLKAIVSIVTAGGPFTDMPRKGGTLVSGMLAWAFAMADKNFKPENMIRNDWDKVIKIRPIKDIPKIALVRDVPFWNYWMQHDFYDEFWSKSNWLSYKENIKVPAMIVSGWFDDNGTGTTEALNLTKDYKKGSKKIFLGPWMHNANTIRDIKGVSFGNNAVRYDLDYYYLAWFDKHLKGFDNHVEDEQSVEYYTIGDNKWRTADNWPLESVKLTKIFLAGNGKGNTSSGDGRLSFENEEDENCDTYIYDPQNPAPHLIDLSENEVGLPDNYIDIEKRNDVLVYTSDQLKKDITIAGDICVEFFASSSAMDTDWIVRLMDVDMHGNSVKLADGIIRAKFRNGFDKIELLSPDKIEKYVIRTSKIGNTFVKGHRIRLTITSSAENFIFTNSNTGNDPASDTESIKAVQKVYHGGRYLSLLKLPILLE